MYWRRQKARIKTIGDASLQAIDKCLILIPNARVHMLEKIYKMICESSILYAAEIWGIEGRGWEIVDGVQAKFFKKMFQNP